MFGKKVTYKSVSMKLMLFLFTYHTIIVWLVASCIHIWTTRLDVSKTPTFGVLIDTIKQLRRHSWLIWDRWGIFMRFNVLNPRSTAAMLMLIVSISLTSGLIATRLLSWCIFKLRISCKLLAFSSLCRAAILSVAEYQVTKCWCHK